MKMANLFVSNLWITQRFIALPVDNRETSVDNRETSVDKSVDKSFFMNRINNVETVDNYGYI